mgnify:FL=1
MKILIFQHTQGENPGAFLQHISSFEDDAHIVHLYDKQPIPKLDEFDLLLVLGGRLNV